MFAPVLSASRRGGWLPLIALGGILVPAAAVAQSATGQESEAILVQQEVFAGDELEEYLRMLQTLGKAELYPWSLRAFGMQEVGRLAPASPGHPWGRRFAFADSAQEGPGVGWVRPRTGVVFNSAIPYGYNDGAMWAGRGVTGFARVGVTARYGPLSLALAPEIFQAQNQDFEILEQSRTGDDRFADPVSPGTIDLPQRFGEGAYGRVSPGQSTLRVDAAGVAAGVSTANQQWGPAWDQPLILGTNAAGFPHLFAGTSRPVNIWIGDLHGRIVWGALGQSPYAPASAATDRRFMSGMVAVFRPRSMAGLEIGGSRFFHSAWSEGGPGLDDFLWPFQSLLKEGLDQTEGPDLSNADNQLASVFARWVLPRGGAEFYGEYAREDHSWNLRDLVLEPDHDSGFVLGMSKAWTQPQDRIVQLRAEVLNAQMTHLARVRHQTLFYRHTQQTQGHTQLGQILGASSGYGGAHARVRIDLYHPRGRWGAGVVRSLRTVPVRAEASATQLGKGADVQYATELSGTFFLRRFDLNAVIAPVYELNRDFSDDVFNLHARLELRARL